MLFVLLRKERLLRLSLKMKAIVVKVADGIAHVESVRKKNEINPRTI